MTKMHASPQKINPQDIYGVRYSEINRCQILKRQKFHPCKLQILHHLTEDKRDRRIEMCEWLSTKLNEISAAVKMAAPASLVLITFLTI